MEAETMRQLPMNGAELTKKVFKGKKVYEPVGLSEIFTLPELCYMLENGSFGSNDRSWMYSAIDKLSEEEQFKRDDSEYHTGRA
jgi:hypothetical protein